MTWFYASSVSVTNGQTVVSVNTGDDVAIAQAAGGLVIGTNQPVEIKRTYLDGSNAKKIELSKPWPYATQTNQPAIAFPTDADLAQATKVLQQLIDGFTVASQVEAQDGANNEHVMTPLRTKQAIDAQVGTAARLTATTSTTDATAGRAMRVGDFGFGTQFAGIKEVYASQAPTAVLSAVGGSAHYVGTILNHEASAPEAWGVVNGYITNSNNYSYSWQEFTGIYGAKYRRTASGANAWNVWTPVYDGQNAVGSVSFLSGVNTGAIIERGSNANGEYVKFADGTLICHTLASPNSQSTSAAAGALWRTNLLLWVYPTSFSDPPIVLGNDKPSFGYVVPAGDTKITYVEYIVVAPNQGIVTGATRLTAIGRWR